MTTGSSIDHPCSGSSPSQDATRVPSIAAMSTALAMMMPYQCSWSGPISKATGSITRRF